jgi:hypothetical protein
VCGAMARTKRRSANIRAVAVVPLLHFVALCHVGARRSSPGPPLRPAGCRARLNRRPIAAVASLDAARRVGETRSRWSACGFGRCAPCGPVRKAGRSRGPRGSASFTSRLDITASCAPQHPLSSRTIEPNYCPRPTLSYDPFPVLPSPFLRSQTGSEHIKFVGRGRRPPG